ncbi:MAG: YkvA family protein [bacterium]
MPLRTGTKVLHNPSFWRLLLHLPKTARLVIRLLKDPRVSFSGKLMFGLALAYLISPLDLIPDFVFPIVGHMDDLGVLLAGVRYLMRQTPPPILEEHLAQLE